MPKRVRSGGAHLCGLAPGQHIFEETLQQWQSLYFLCYKFFFDKMGDHGSNCGLFQ